MFVVADGRGATELGSIASLRAVERMVDGFEHAAERASLPSLMPRLVQHANTAVHDEALIPDRRGKRFATTIIACALRDHTAVISHVGDSRCYQVRDNHVTLLTQDHTSVAEQTKAGTITAMQAEHSENRHVLTRSLGPDLSVSPDTGSFPVLPGDVLVLCTDGLYEAMYPEDLVRIISQDIDPAAIARKLVAYAVQADGSDNMTALVVRVRNTESVSPGRNASP
jgi:protein phosphatase